MGFYKTCERTRVLDATDKVSLMVIYGKVKNLDQGLNNVRLSFLQLVCLDKLYKGEGDKGDLDGIQDEIEPFQNKKWFLLTGKLC